MDDYYIRQKFRDRNLEAFLDFSDRVFGFMKFFGLHKVSIINIKTIW